MRERPADSGLGGRLDIRPSPRGGCGKALMLTVFLSVLPVALYPEAVLGVGKAPEGAGVAGGRRFEDGVRRAFGDAGVDLVGGTASPPMLFRVFPTGSAGRAI